MLVITDAPKRLSSLPIDVGSVAVSAKGSVIVFVRLSQSHDFADVYQSLRSAADTSRARVRAAPTSEAVTMATPSGRCPSDS